jgi:hypothetical protein
MSPRVIRVACPQSHRKSHRHAPDGRELSRRPAPGFMSERRYRDDVYVLAESSVRHHDAAPLDLFATASLRWLQGPLPLSLIDRRRFRPNMCSRFLAANWSRTAGSGGGSRSRVAYGTDAPVGRPGNGRRAFLPRRDLDSRPFGHVVRVDLTGSAFLRHVLRTPPTSVA